MTSKDAKTTSAWFVDGRDGSDANDGSPEQPFATIAHAMSVALMCDTIIVEAGTYDRPVLDSPMTLGADDE